MFQKEVRIILIVVKYQAMLLSQEKLNFLVATPSYNQYISMLLKITVETDLSCDFSVVNLVDVKIF